MATIRQEINITDESSAAPTGQIQIQNANYDGATYYFEVVGLVASGTATVTLRRVGTTTDDATLSVTATSNTRVRSASFTPSAATSYFVFVSGGTSPAINSARVVIIQAAVTQTETQVEIGGKNLALTNTVSGAPPNQVKYWLYTAANWDNSPTFAASVSWVQSSSKVAVTITLQEDNGSFASWVDKVTIVNAGTFGTTARWDQSTTFTPTDGRHYRIAAFIATTKATYDLYNAKIHIISPAGFTKVEAQYLLLNNQQSATGLNGYQTSWTVDGSEWSGVTNTHKHAQDSGSASASSKLQQGGVDLASSTVTGANQQISSTITMPAGAGEIDTYIVSNGIPVAGSRILVLVVVSAVVATDPPFLRSQPTNHYRFDITPVYQ